MKRQLYLTAGLVSVALGTIGIFLPLLPTVPFMILAAFCFAKSSPALEKRLIEDRRFGPHILAWREKGAISRKGKLAATAAFAVSIALGLWMMAMPWALIPIGVAVICLSWLWSRPER
ncbi:YbaN family protein [Sphingorhabdus arenilitoris]|uniref:YbaN family protein n=1 Tax=Sphingorhabdus arenilitoris TaxID=1490041 RepID=A0ABV8RC98_9SPHN